MKTRAQRIEEQTRLVDIDLQDRTCKVLVKENEIHRWDVRCYDQRGNHLSYIGGTLNVSTFDKAHKLARFYAPCPEAIRVEVGVAM